MKYVQVKYCESDVGDNEANSKLSSGDASHMPNDGSWFSADTMCCFQTSGKEPK